MDQQKIGAFISARRQLHGLTQRDLADRLNVTDKAVSKWERGLSYPDITLVTLLAQALGVTERELLLGELEQEEPDPPAHIVRDTLDYAKRSVRQQRVGAAQTAMVIYSAVLLLSVFITMLCDLVLNRTATWSLIVLASCALAWAVTAPFFYAKSRRLFWSAICLSALLPLLLLSIAYVSPVKGWLLWPGLPITAASLGLVWALVILCTFTRLSRWTIMAVGVLLCGPLNLFINRIVLQTPSEPDGWWALFNWIIIAACAATFFLVGLTLSKLKRGKMSA